MYANEYSTNYNIININVNSGMAEEILVPERTILEQKVKGKTIPYFQSIEYSPRVIPVSFAFDNTFDNNKLQNAVRWLCGQEYYKPLIFSENPNRIYYALVAESELKLIHNYNYSGYITLNFRCNDYYAYSPLYQKYFDLSNNTESGMTVEIMNLGDITIYPKLEIYKNTTESFQINNLSNNNLEFKFNSISDDTIVTVYNEEEIIESSNVGEYLNNQFNNNYLALVRGSNKLKILGKAQLKIIYQYKYL